jgi:hypothetical protein
VRRTAGWSILAITALELMALALLTRAMRRDPRPEREPGPLNDSIDAPQDDPADVPVDDPAAVSSASAPARETVDALGFITEAGDSNARYYRASDALGEVLAAFFDDGRMRLADGMHRFAGMVQNGHADLLELADNTWSEVFVRVTPDGSVQLELRGGPYDARVLTCRPLAEHGAV